MVCFCLFTADDNRNLRLKAAISKYQRHIFTSFCVVKPGPPHLPPILQFDGNAVNIFLKHVATLSDLLLTAVHIFAGSPARGTEMEKTLLRNAARRGGTVQMRNVFYMSHFDAIAIVLSYNKVGTCIIISHVCGVCVCVNKNVYIYMCV